MTFNDRLRELRQAAGLTQEQLAERAGMPIGTLRTYEYKNRHPGFGAVVQLAAALGVDCTAFADCDEFKGGGADGQPAAKEKPKTGRQRKKGR